MQLRRLTATLDNAVEQAYRNAGLDFRPRYFPIFQLLLEEEAATVGEIVNVVGLTQPAVTQTLNLMRQNGLVSVIASKDQRERHYTLTEQARDQVASLQPIWDAVAKAAADLDRLLPSPLGETVEAAIQQLVQTPFSKLIQRRLSK
jgi:DNA-binding MarR family transcriptional regulator